MRKQIKPKKILARLMQPPKKPKQILPSPRENTNCPYHEYEWNITRGSIDTKIIKEYGEHYANKFNNLQEIDKYFKRDILSNFTQENTDNCYTYQINWIYALKSFHKETLRRDGFTGNSTKCLRKK